MSKVDWSLAPKDAQYYANKAYWKCNKDVCGYLVLVSADGVWVDSTTTLAFAHSPFIYDDVQSRADHIVDANKKTWPSESRIAIIGTNGNDGCHYDEVLHHTERSVAENVFKLSIEPKFMLEQELFEKLHDLVHQYDGRLSVVACIGALELVKQSVIAGE